MLYWLCWRVQIREMVRFPYAMALSMKCVIFSLWSGWTLKCLRVCNSQVMVPVTVVTVSRWWKSSGS